LNNKKKKINDNKKILNNNKKSVSNKYLVIGITALIAIAGIAAISYPYFASSNTNLESSSDKSNMLGDWHDIHGVGLFNSVLVIIIIMTIPSILQLIMVCITKRKFIIGSSWK